MKTRAVLCGGGELAGAAEALGLVPSEPAQADIALIDLRSPEALPAAAVLGGSIPRVVVVHDAQAKIAEALGIPAKVLARSCEPAVLGPLIAAALPAGPARATRSVLVTSCRGGVGRSLLVANLARRVATTRATIALDITGTGALGWWLGAACAGWEDLEGLSDELSAEQLAVVATEVTAGLRILGGAPQAPSNALTDRVLRAALELAELVLIDAPTLTEERARQLAGSVGRVIVLTYDDAVSVATLGAANVPPTAWLIASQSSSATIADRDVFRTLPRAEASIAAAASSRGPVEGALGKAYDELAELVLIDSS